MFRPLPLLAAAALGTAAFAAHAATDRPDVSTMSIKDIRIHNEGLDKSDPYFISCRRYTVTGSLAKKERVCLTKEAWDKRTEEAQDFVNQRMDAARKGPCGDCPTGG